MNRIRLSGPCVAAFITVFSLVLSGCGDDSEKNGSKDDIIYVGTYGAAEYYSFLNECDEAMRNGRKVSYNIKGEVIREKICSYDAATRVQKVTERRMKVGILELDSYSEIIYDLNNKVVESKEWRDAEKKDLRREHSFTYGADGKLVQSVEKSEDGENVTTTTYDAGEVPSKETTVRTSGGTATTTVSTCVTYFVDYRPCEKTRDGKIEETMTIEGEEYVRKQLVKDQLTEIERFTFILPGGYLYKNRSYKYYGFDGELRYESDESCTLDGDTATCSEVKKTPDGKEFSTESSTHKNFGKVSNTVGSTERVYDALIEVAGNFSAIAFDKEYSGSYSSTFDVETFNRDADISFSVKTASHPELKSIYITTPYWNQMSGSLEDLFKEGAFGAVTFKEKSLHNGQRKETLSEITGFSGLTTDQVNPDFVFKEEYICQ